MEKSITRSVGLDVREDSIDMLASLDDPCGT